MLAPLFRLLSPGGAGPLSILIFHRVLPAPDPMFPEEMHATRFDALLARLAQWFSVLPLDEAVVRLGQRSLPPRALAITFDDGYADNHAVALPLLTRHRLPATFFIATGFLDGGRMWNDSLIEAVRRCPQPELDAGAWGRHPLSSAAARRRAADTLIDAIKYLEPAAREAAVAEVAARAGVELPRDLMLRSTQVRALRAAGMGVGAHTRNHPILARLSLEAARDEIAGGRAELEALLGERVGLFAYPNGKPGQDYLAQHTALVRELGFDAAVATAWGCSGAATDRYQLARFTPWDQDFPRFGLRLAHNLAFRREPQHV